MPTRILLYIFACLSFGQAVAIESNDTYTLYLVRHAEKQLSSDHDPDLNNAGKIRSHQLADWLQNKNIKDTRNTKKKTVVFYYISCGQYHLCIV